MSLAAPSRSRGPGRLFLWGLASALAFSPLYLFPVMFWSLGSLLESLENLDSPGQALWRGWLFGLGYFMGNCYWFYSPLLVEPLKYAWLIPFALTLVPSFLASYTALATLATWLFGRFSNNRFFLALAFALFWSVSEYARGILATGFPWNLIGYSLAFSPLLLQTVSIFGSHVFGFLLLLLYTSPYPLGRQEYRRCSLFYCLLVLFILGFGFFRLKNAETHSSSFLVRLVQPNLPQGEKITARGLEKSLEEMLAMSLEGAAGVDYLVWPESALPYPIFSGERNQILETIGHRIGSRITLITGALRIEGTSREIYNSLIVLRDSRIVDYYDKYHLAPFGEFIPFSNVFRFLTALTGIGNFSRAKVKNKIIRIDDTFPPFSPSICYESIFTDSVNGKGGARLIVNITNDAWLGRTSGPAQHFDALKFRALENRMAAIRVANSGISGVIDKYGRVIRKMGLARRGVLDVTIPL